MPQLIDGTEVDGASEAWRHECVARAIAALPTLAQRREWLEQIERRRGKGEADRIRQTMGELWQAKQGAPHSRWHQATTDSDRR
jgi:hypothetical protein